ncbi:uncharacterized protein [Amphiura filiformis]|uniref:uncharacterized protein n=1 Tax=Amphiura filiformis TaxID=82378 RepID=UPI003B227215
MLTTESSSESEVTEIREKSSSPEIVESADPVLEVEGFVHNMTPIKSGKSSKYFYAILQVSQKDYINMICFSTEQHQLLMSMARSKGALKFSNITFNSRIGSGGQNVTVNARTKITKTSVKFYATKPFWSFLANFCSIQAAETSVDDGDHIHVAVTVQSCNNKTVEQVVRGSGVDRKDFVVTDKSGTTTLSTWGEYTDILQIGKTYMVGNVTVKLLKGVKCLNTNIRTSIIEGVWDRKKHELDYTIVFPSVYPDGGGSSLEAQKKVALQPGGGSGRGLLGQGPSRDSGRSSHSSGGSYYGSSSGGGGHTQSNPYPNYPTQQWGNYQQNYYGGNS